MVVPFPGVWCYLSDYYAPAAEAILDELRLHLPGVAWSARSDWAWPPAGECIDEPALVLLVAPLARESFRLFFGPAVVTRGTVRVRGRYRGDSCRIIEILLYLVVNLGGASLPRL